MDPLQIEENLSDLRQPYLLLTFSGLERCRRGCHRGGPVFG